MVANTFFILVSYLFKYTVSIVKIHIYIYTINNMKSRLEVFQKIKNKIRCLLLFAGHVSAVTLFFLMGEQTLK